MELTVRRRTVVNEAPTASGWKAGALYSEVAFSQTVFFFATQWDRVTVMPIRARGSGGKNLEY